MTARPWISGRDYTGPPRQGKENRQKLRIRAATAPQRLVCRPDVLANLHHRRQRLSRPCTLSEPRSIPRCSRWSEPAARHAWNPASRPLELDVFDPDQLQRALAPGDTLVHLIGTPHPNPARRRSSSAWTWAACAPVPQSRGVPESRAGEQRAKPCAGNPASAGRTGDPRGMKVLAFCGSLRRVSMNAALLRARRGSRPPAWPSSSSMASARCRCSTRISKRTMPAAGARACTPPSTPATRCSSPAPSTPTASPACSRTRSTGW